MTARNPTAAVRTLTRYVLTELLTVFLLTLAGMTALIFVAQLGQEAVDKGLGLGPLVRIMPYLLPQAMQFAVPGTMLLATVSVYGRMASTNEVVAIKSMGISPWAIVTPTLVLATLVSLGAVLVNDVAVSWGRLGVQRVVLESFEEVVYGQLRVHRTFSNDNVSITVRRVEGRKLVQPTVTAHVGESGEPWTGSADWAELESLPDKDQVVIRFHNSEVHGDEGFTAVESETFEEVMSLDQLAGKGGGRSPSTYALSEIGPAVTRQKETINRMRQDLTAQATLALLTGEIERMAEPAWAPPRQKLAGAQMTLHRLHAEPYRRWANGFSCLAFVMVGVPVAVILRKGEMLASFFTCFAPILLVYYPLLIVSVSHAKEGAIPPIGVWVGNLVLAVAGAYLMRRVVRY